MECTEVFYKGCIEEELDIQDSDDASKREMIDILKRVYGENEESGKYLILIFYYITNIIIVQIECIIII